jgi:hypothetical protein
MTSMQELEALTGGIKPLIPLPKTRFDAWELEPVYWTPPYSSIVDDAFIRNRLHLRQEKIRMNALHPVKLQAGQSVPVNGELGRPAARAPIMVPEMLGGRLLYTNV